MAEIMQVVEKGDAVQLAWFAGFGDSFRQILMIVNEYRRGLQFGFTEIAFNEYGWLARHKFLEFEEIKLEQSSIRIGRGPNCNWAYSLSLTYGMAGSSGPLSASCLPFQSREAALAAALTAIKNDMSAKLGNTDTSNYKPDLILKTLRAISEKEVAMVQLTLF